MWCKTGTSHVRFLHILIWKLEWVNLYETSIESGLDGLVEVIPSPYIGPNSKVQIQLRALDQSKPCLLFVDLY